MIWIAKIIIGRSGNMLVSALRWLSKPMTSGRWFYLLLMLLALLQAARVQHERHGHYEAVGQLMAARAAFALTVDQYRRAAQQAVAADKINQRRVEDLWRGQLQEAVNEDAQLRARYRGAVTQFVRTNGAATPADSGSGTAAAVPDAATLSGPAVQPSDTAVVPVADLNLCADAFARAQALMAAWTAASEVPVNSPNNDVATPPQ